MLQRFGEFISACLQRADECSKAAAFETNDRVHSQLLELEQQWQHLAKSYEFIETLERFARQPLSPAGGREPTGIGKADKALPRRLEAVSPQSKERDESRRHCCQHCTTRNDERGCGPELRFASFFKRQPGALARFVQLSSSSFDPLQLQIVEVVLD